MSRFWILRFFGTLLFYLSRPFCLSHYPQSPNVTNNFCRKYGCAEVKKKGNSTLLQHNHRYSPLSPPPNSKLRYKSGRYMSRIEKSAHLLLGTTYEKGNSKILKNTSYWGTANNFNNWFFSCLHHVFSVLKNCAQIRVLFFVLIKKRL